MLFPSNPEKRPELWQNLESQLLSTNMCFVVSNGSGNPLVEAQEPVEEIVHAVLSRLRSSQFCRISANRGNAISPHFAGRFVGTSAFLDELITYPYSGKTTVDIKQLRNDLETAVIDLFATAGATSVAVPLHLDPWSMENTLITLGSGGMVFTDAKE